MENLVTLAIPAVVGLLVLRTLAKPLRWAGKLALNGAGGLLCLLILNTSAGFTGLYMPVNAVTVGLSGIFGLPGMVLVALLEMV